MKISKLLATSVPLAMLVIIPIVYPGGRGIRGDYRLMRDESHTTYHLNDTAQPENQLGNTGPVVRIGWDKHRIVMKRFASPTKDTPWSNEAGWVIIYVDRKKTSRTMTDAEFQQLSNVAGIATYSPDSAYKRGHWW
jgi:hypothetical protein